MMVVEEKPEDRQTRQTEVKPEDTRLSMIDSEERAKDVLHGAMLATETLMRTFNTKEGRAIIRKRTEMTTKEMGFWTTIFKNQGCTVQDVAKMLNSSWVFVWTCLHLLHNRGFLTLEDSERRNKRAKLTITPEQMARATASIDPENQGTITPEGKNMAFETLKEGNIFRNIPVIKHGPSMKYLTTQEAQKIGKKIS